MNVKLATRSVIIAAMLATLGACASDGTDSDRSHPITYVKDSVITIKVKAMLADEKIASLAKISVDTDDHGVVTLSGNVRTQDEADKAVSITRKIENVKSVQSNLKIKKDD
jgi:hyperosmotically inducible periplasmic protein